MLRKVILLFILLLPLLAVADDVASSWDRKGLVLGFGLGGGYQSLYTQTDIRNKPILAGDLRVGAGVNNRILVLFTPNFNYTRIDGGNLLSVVFPVAGQFFLYRDLYARPSFGATISTKSFSAANTLQSTAGKLSFAGDLAVGYEFHINKVIAISPEAYYRYIRIPASFYTSQVHIFGAQISLTSYLNY